VLLILHQQSAASLIRWHAAPLHRLLQISGHGLWQIYQFEYCSWCSATSFHSWYFPHQTVHTGTWPYSRSHICVWLLETYAVPAGMCASQVWATPVLRQGKEVDNP